MLKLRDSGPCFLLESAEQGQRLGRYSMIGVDPQAVITARDGTLVMRRDDGSEDVLDPSDPFGTVQSIVDDVKMAPPTGDLAFWGGAVGFFGYDLVRTVEHLPDVPQDDLGIPDMVMMLTGPVVLFDHLRRSTTIIVPCPVAEGVDIGPEYDHAVGRIAAIKATLQGPVPPHRPHRSPQTHRLHMRTRRINAA
jgi:anthranilate synthase component 1